MLLLSLFISLCLSGPHPLSPRPRSRLQYSLDVADRLADEHVLIGLYVNMLQSNPARLVQVWHLWGTQQRDVGRPRALLASSWLHITQLSISTNLKGMCMHVGYVLPELAIAVIPSSDAK